jgi:hypothetical protein
MSVEFQSVWMVGGFFVFLAGAVTISLISHGNGALIGKDFTGSLPLWATWWPEHAIANNYDMVSNHYAIYPIETNLLSLLSITTSVVYHALAPFLGPILAYNILLPLFLTLNGLFWYLFFNKQLRFKVSSSLIGAVIIAFNPISLNLANHGEFALLATFWFPIWFWRWDRFIKRPTLRNVVFAALCLYLIVLTSLQFWNIVLSFLLLSVIVIVLKRSEIPGAFLDHLLVGALIFGVLFLLYPASALFWSTYGSIYEILEVWQGYIAYDRSDLILMGIVAIGSVIPIFRRSSIRKSLYFFWLAFAVLNIMYALNIMPSTLEIIFHPIQSIGDVTQSSVYLSIALAALTITALHSLETVIKNKTASLRIVSLVAIPFIIAISGWFRDLPISPVFEYALHKQLAEENEDYLIAELPIGIDNLAYSQRATESSDREDLQRGAVQFGSMLSARRTMAYVPYHHKRIMGGYTQSVYADEIQVYKANPLIQILTFQPIKTNRAAMAREIREWVEAWRLGYIVIHRDEVSVDQIQELYKWLYWTNALCFIGEEEDLEIWRAGWHPEGCPPFVLAFGDRNYNFAIKSGWHAPEISSEGQVRWAGDQNSAKVQVWMMPSSDFQLSLRAAAPGIDDQHVEVVVNDQKIGDINLTDQMNVYKFPLSRGLFRQGGFLTIELRHSRIESLQGRKLTAVYDYLSLSVLPSD